MNMILNNCNMIVAVDENMAIGKGGELLCHLPDDLRHFKHLTMGHPVVMGRKTYESLPVRPLPGRPNFVITAAKDNIEGATVLHEPMDILSHIGADEEFFVIGGESVYRTFLPYAKRIYVTHIHYAFDGADRFFPRFRTIETGSENPQTAEEKRIKKKGAPAMPDYYDWRIVSSECHPSDERNPYPFTFVTYERC